MFPNLLAWYKKTKPNTSGPMTNVMAAQLNIGGALCKSSVTTPQSLADGRCSSVMQSHCQYRRTQDLDAN